MPELSRRTVVEGLGTLTVASIAPVGVGVAAAHPLPELEDFFGEQRMAALRRMYRDGAEALADEWITEDALFTPDERFRLSAESRDGLTIYLRERSPVAIPVASTWYEVMPGMGLEQAQIDSFVAHLFWAGNVFPADTHRGIPRTFPTSICYWQGDGWREAGWPPPSDTSFWQSCSVEEAGRYFWPELLV